MPAPTRSWPVLPGSVAVGLAWQLAAAPSFELAALSPRAVNLAGRVPAGKCDEGPGKREYKGAYYGDHLQYDDDRDDNCDHGENCSHVTDYRTA
jgi:hypothetical protein